MLRLLTYPPPLFTSILVADDVYASALRTSCWLKKIPKKVHNWTRPSPFSKLMTFNFHKILQIFFKKRKFFLCELLIKSYTLIPRTHPPPAFFLCSGGGGEFAPLHFWTSYVCLCHECYSKVRKRYIAI